MSPSMTEDLDDSAWLEKWLSEPRLKTYLSRCHGNRDEAMRLYEWNSDRTDELHRWVDHMLSRQAVTAWDINSIEPRQAVTAWDINSIEPDQSDETLFVSWTFSATEGEDYTFDGISRIHFDSDGRIDHVKEYRADHDQHRPFESKG